jgi:hypothetical protein
MAYYEGFLASSDLEHAQQYQDAFKKGKLYSLEFGKILGKIEYFLIFFLLISGFISLVTEMKFLNQPVSEDDILNLKLIKEESEKYQQKLTGEIIITLNEKIENIISKYFT